MNNEIIVKNYQEFYDELKSQHPIISIGYDNQIVQLDAEAYEARLDEWTNNLLAKQAEEIVKEQAELEAKSKRETAELKLAALGLTPDDLKALGL